MIPADIANIVCQVIASANGMMYKQIRPMVSPDISHREIDQALQSLRKASRIQYLRKTGWVLT